MDRVSGLLDGAPLTSTGGMARYAQGSAESSVGVAKWSVGANISYAPFAESVFSNQRTLYSDFTLRYSITTFRYFYSLRKCILYKGYLFAHGESFYFFFFPKLR